MAEAPGAAQPEPWWKSQTTAVVALVATVVLSVGGSFLTAFLTVGSWVRADIQEVRREVGELRRDVQDLRTRVERVERNDEERRKQLESWVARRFTETCIAWKGAFDKNLNACVLPNGHFLKYEPPYL